MAAVKFDKDKLRYDLEPVNAREQVVRVISIGAKKYGERNWEKGFAWSRLIGAAERHFKAFKEGEDFDPETGEYHLAHAACNIMFLLENYRIYPQGDDRKKNYFRGMKIGLDIDEVLCDFIGGYSKRFGITETPESWNFDPDIKKNIEDLKDDDDFYMNLEKKIHPRDIPFEPHCYITSRSCKKEVTEKWLHKNGYPNRPIYVVGINASKVEAAKQSGIDVFVDDRFENFRELEKAGICCFLLDAPHNQRWGNVGFKRIKNLKFFE